MADIFRYALLFAASLTLSASPALARRTSVDQITDPSDPDGPGLSVIKVLSGYCDLTGEECGSGEGATLGYAVSFDGGANYTNQIFVTGNGLLTFGSGVDFFGSADSSGQTLSDLIYDGQDPSLEVYGLNLISAGQSNYLDFNGGGGFMQSAKLSVENNMITASWYTCNSPFDCNVNSYNLKLKPTNDGFYGSFDFSSGSPGGSDRGYVSGGAYTGVEASFFLPAQLKGLSASAVPEPSSWMLMISGFGLIGGVLRRRAVRARLVSSQPAS
ncbi:MAG: PEPxxWA-CTERM sorting domain-containing protein [Rhizorhabdus sp.]